LGTNTDPYQRAEGRYRLMPGIIEALASSSTPFSVLTKGTLLRRDLPFWRRLRPRSRFASACRSRSSTIHCTGCWSRALPHPDLDWVWCKRFGKPDSTAG
ncbi:MAG TPA: hypothetical protein VFH02_03665, partial [Jiangellaceae bacterium]|nr:hypothetical protein [Jiangellaceae bacterium]